MLKQTVASSKVDISHVLIHISSFLDQFLGQWKIAAAWTELSSMVKCLPGDSTSVFSSEQISFARHSFFATRILDLHNKKEQEINEMHGSCQEKEWMSERKQFSGPNIGEEKERMNKLRWENQMRLLRNMYKVPGICMVPECVSDGLTFHYCSAKCRVGDFLHKFYLHPE